MNTKAVFLLLFLFSIVLVSCDTGEYYEILEDDTIEAKAIDSLNLVLEENKIHEFNSEE